MPDTKDPIKRLKKKRHKKNQTKKSTQNDRGI